MRTRTAMLAATLLSAGGAMAQTQTAPATYDPNQLPATHGKVAQYSLTPRGDVDGLILADGTEVHLPPHLGTQLAFSVKPGDAVTIHGLAARALPMIQAMSITNDVTGASIVDNGPGGPRAAETPMAEQGQIKAQLHGPAGDLNGVLLQDGTIVRLPPLEAQRLSSTLTPGAPLYVRGSGLFGPLGRVIEAEEIGPSPNQLALVAAPRLPPRPGRFPPPPPAPPAPGQAPG